MAIANLNREKSPHGLEPRPGDRRDALNYAVVKRIDGAGGVVFNPLGEVLLIRYPGRRGSWDFPKGHIDPGETIEIAAVREVLEEGGVSAQIQCPLQNTEYVNPRGEARRVYWFLMLTDATVATPEPNFKAGFYDLTTALGKLRHAQNRALLLQGAEFLGQISK